MPGRLEFDLGFGRSGRRPRDGDEPMRLLLFGDFSGRPTAARPPLATRPIDRVDLDNINDRIRRLEPRVHLPTGDIRIEQIDDFHPDRLYARLDLFQALRQARATPPANSDELLGRLLGKASGPGTAPAAASAGGLDQLIRNIVAPHIVQDASAHTAPYLAAVDDAIAAEMRKLLHDPAFQSLEAAWRGVQWLISDLELGENLQLHLFDVTRQELLADLVAAEGKLAQTAFYRAVIERYPSAGAHWSALVGLMAFGPSTPDVALLAALGVMASQAGGPLLAGADWTLTSDAARASAAWMALRHSDAARWIALAAPRVLLRLPYGSRRDPVETFAFEELVGPPAPGELLWADASLAMALLLGRSFSARGWDMEPGDEREIGDLPACTFVRDGEQELQPCGEHAFAENHLDTLLKAGIVPIASRRDRNAVVAVRFQSIAEPTAPLAW
jgi:type VI secretion system protein ImpC